jgi:hypothetical protein
MFNEANGEHLFVFAKIEPVLEDVRKAWNAPDMLKNFETLSAELQTARRRWQRSVSASR